MTEVTNIRQFLLQEGFRYDDEYDALTDEQIETSEGKLTLARAKVYATAFRLLVDLNDSQLATVKALVIGILKGKRDEIMLKSLQDTMWYQDMQREHDKSEDLTWQLVKAYNEVIAVVESQIK